MKLDLRHMGLSLLSSLLLLAGLLAVHPVDLTACDDCPPQWLAVHDGPCDQAEHHHHRDHDHCAVCQWHGQKVAANGSGFLWPEQNIDHAVTFVVAAVTHLYQDLHRERAPPAAA